MTIIDTDTDTDTVALPHSLGLGAGHYPIQLQVYQVPLDGVTFSLSKIASFYVSHIWYEGVTLASHGRGKSQNTRYANDVAEFV